MIHANLHHDPIAMRNLAEMLVYQAAVLFKVSVDDLIGSSRSPLLVQVRRVVYYVARDFGCSYPQIGRALGQDHTTVMHHMRRIGDLPPDHPFFEYCEQLKEQHDYASPG